MQLEEIKNPTFMRYFVNGNIVCIDENGVKTFKKTKFEAEYHHRYVVDAEYYMPISKMETERNKKKLARLIGLESRFEEFFHFVTVRDENRIEFYYLALPDTVEGSIFRVSSNDVADLMQYDDGLDALRAEMRQFPGNGALGSPYNVQVDDGGQITIY